MSTTEVAVLELEIGYVSGCIEYLSLKSIKGFPIITSNNPYHVKGITHKPESSKCPELIMLGILINPLKCPVPGSVHRHIVEIGLSRLLPSITTAAPFNRSIGECGFCVALVAHLSQVHSEQPRGFVKPLSEGRHNIDTVMSTEEDHGSSFITVLISCHPSSLEGSWIIMVGVYVETTYII